MTSHISNLIELLVKQQHTQTAQNIFEYHINNLIYFDDFLENSVACV